MDRLLPFVTDYTTYIPPLNAVLRRWWQHIYNDSKFYSLLPNAQFTTFRSTKNVARLLSTQRRCFRTERLITNLDLGNAEPFRLTRFNRHRAVHHVRGMC